MKLAVLDGYALNPGDLSWEAFARLADITVYQRTSANQILERAASVDLVLTNKTPLSGETLRQLPRLKYIGVLATGYNIVDVRAAMQLGITVTNVPRYGTSSVAQLTFALLLELCHTVGNHNVAVRAGAWNRSLDWSFWLTPLVELAGKQLGLVGFGRIGRQVAKIADAFGMRVMVANRGNPDVSGSAQIDIVSLQELLSNSDVISLHCPLTAETQAMIGSKQLALMKPSAFLINTSRGQLIIDQDLADALNSNRLAGAGLDVLSMEPPPHDNPLLGAKNCILTPHIAWATREARARLMDIAGKNLAAFLEGNQLNLITA
jgi:glycerate dehydrogenase